MSSGTRITHATALHLADKIVTALRPGCSRIEIAGSLRRRERFVGDVEIVAIPSRTSGLFPGQGGASLLDRLLDNLVQAKRLRPGRLDGERQKQFFIPAIDGLKLDLFITDEPRWGYRYAICTGPAEFVHRCVTQRCEGGRLCDGLIVMDSQLWHRADALPTGRQKKRLVFVAGERREVMVDVLQPRPGAVPFATPEERDFFALAGGFYAANERHINQPIVDAAAVEQWIVVPPHAEITR